MDLQSFRPFSPDNSHTGLIKRVAALESSVALLRLGEDHKSRILTSAVDYAIITLNLGGRVTSWNSGAAQMLGYSEEEILDRSADTLFTPEDRSQGAFIDELCRAFDYGRATSERWHVRQDGSRFWASGTMTLLVDAKDKPRGFLNIFRDASEVHRDTEAKEIKLGEMAHRIRNTLATVQAIAMQTGRSTEFDDAFEDRFGSRIGSIANAHGLLETREHPGVQLSDLIARSLKAYVGLTDRVVTEGPPLLLAPDDVLVLGLILHELATNSVKYGAFSVPQGRVDISWNLGETGRAIALAEILWREQRGPLVQAPTRCGFGTRLLEYGLMQASGGSLHIDYNPKGVECRMRLPALVPAR
jgi:PAS domain S-box-containing protein